MGVIGLLQITIGVSEKNTTINIENCFATRDKINCPPIIKIKKKRKDGE